MKYLKRSLYILVTAASLSLVSAGAQAGGISIKIGGYGHGYHGHNFYRHHAYGHNYRRHYRPSRSYHRNSYYGGHRSKGYGKSYYKRSNRHAFRNHSSRGYNRGNRHGNRHGNGYSRSSRKHYR